MIYQFNGIQPVIDPTAFVHPQAAVTGNVRIGKKVYIGPGAAIRGDWGQIFIDDGCNVQENCTIHMFPGTTVWLKEGAHIGHGAIIHGAVIGRNCLIGMNSVILDNVEIGDECIIGALSLVLTGEKIPGRSVVAGNPAKIIKPVSEEMIRWKTEGTALYQALPGDMRADWGLCEPLLPPTAGRAGGLAASDAEELRAPEADQATPANPDNPPGGYQPWKSTSGRD